MILKGNSDIRSMCYILEYISGGNTGPWPLASIWLTRRFAWLTMQLVTMDVHCGKRTFIIVGCFRLWNCLSLWCLLPWIRIFVPPCFPCLKTKSHLTKGARFCLSCEWTSLELIHFWWYISETSHMLFIRSFFTLRTTFMQPWMTHLLFQI